MGDESRAKELLTTLDNYSSAEAEKAGARKALLAMGAVAVGPILDFIEGGHKLFGEVELMEGIGRPAVAPILTRLDSCSWYTFMRCAEALGKIRDATAVAPLVDVLKTRDWAHAKQREYAAEALGHIGDSSAVPALLTVLEVGDHNDATGMKAAKALGSIGEASAIEPLLVIFRKARFASGSVRSDEVVHQRMIPAAWSLAMLGVQEVEDAIKHMIAHAGDAYSLPYVSTNEVDDLREALKTLHRKTLPADVAEKAQRKELLEGVRSMDVGRRKSACYESAAVGGAEVVKAVIDALDHDPGPQYNKAEDLYQSSRKGAAYALGRIGDSASVSVLLRCLRDDWPWEVKDGRPVERRDNPPKHELGMPVFGTSVREGLEEAATEFARSVLAQAVSPKKVPSANSTAASNRRVQAQVPSAATSPASGPSKVASVTCPTCKGARRITRELRRKWWQVLLFRPSATSDLCSTCLGSGVIKSSPNGDPDQAVRQSSHKSPGHAQASASASAPLGKVLCMIDLSLPPDVVWKPHSLDEVLLMCANYCWNPVDRHYNFDEAHRYTVQREGQITICTDPSNPLIRFQLNVPSELATAAPALMRHTWQEVMDTIRQYGVGYCLNDFKSRKQ